MQHFTVSVIVWQNNVICRIGGIGMEFFKQCLNVGRVVIGGMFALGALGAFIEGQVFMLMLCTAITSALISSPTKTWKENYKLREEERKRQADAVATDEAKNALAMAKNLIEKLGNAESTLSKNTKDGRKVALSANFAGIEAQERLWGELLDASIELQRLEDHVERA
jgi:poly(A) polymerase Pap1